MPNSSQTSQLQQVNFLNNNHEMGELILNYDWSKTSLGPIEDWPEGLKINISNIINSGFPMFLFWGDDFICFYNDAFRPSLGTEGKHPAIGKKAIAVWGEIWYIVGPLLQQVYVEEKAVTMEDQLIPFYRNGKVEDIYWTFSYSPCFGENNEVKGVLVTCVETTKHVLAAGKPPVPLTPDNLTL